jgi:hypothetical protein
MKMAENVKLSPQPHLQSILFPLTVPDFREGTSPIFCRFLRFLPVGSPSVLVLPFKSIIIALTDPYFMKKALTFSLLLVLTVFVKAQDATIQDKITEVNTIIAEQLPTLEEFLLELEVHKKELEERLIVLKYHQINKEVVEASYAVVDRIGGYYDACMTRIAQFESQWFSQTRNFIDIYTRYGELKESSGEGNELAGFVKDHSDFLDQLDSVKNLLIACDVDIQDIKNKI